MPLPALLQQPQLGVLSQPEPQGILSTFDRDPAYEYGNILPFRKPVTGGPAQWGLGYSNALKSLYDAFTAPGRALQGQQMTPEDAMNFALASGIGGMALGSAPAGSLGMNVFHGSPHNFEKFDLSKVGTGEGAQAYGHGLYFAENPKVAASYKEPRFDNFDVKQVDGGWELSLPGGEKKVFPTLKAADEHMGSMGNLYKVDLPDEHIAKMLDWDKPLSQQSASVQESLRSVQWKDPDMLAKFWDRPAGDFYRKLASRESGKAGASSTLRWLGIPGIKFLDQGSRAVGEGTHNFVVFDDSLPRILGRD